MKLRLLVLALVAVLTLGAASGVLASDVVDLQLNVVRVASDEVQTTQISALDDDGEIFVPLQVLFLAVDVPYVVRDGDVYFPVGNGIESVEIEKEDGVEYVSVRDTLQKLGVQRELVNGRELTIYLW